MFKPKLNQEFYMLNSRFEVRKTVNTGSIKQQKRIEAGNAFETQAQANAFRSMVSKAAHGEFEGFRRTPVLVKIISKVIEILLYILVLALIVAAIYLIIDFVMWLRG